MHRIARRQPLILQNNLLCAFDYVVINWQDLIDHTEKHIESRLNSVSTIDRNVTMKKFLQDFGICHQTLAVTSKFFEKSLCICLVGMRRAHKVHRDIRVNQYHPPALSP